MIAIAVVGIVVLLAVPLGRPAAPVEAELTTMRVAPDRVSATVTIEPPLAAEEADWFEVLSWQGGGLEITPLRHRRSGVYETVGSVPVGGDWKTVVRLARKDVLVAIPIYLPADPQIGASLVPVEPMRSAAFVRDTELLMREAHGGRVWPTIVAYGLISTLAMGWIALLLASFARGARSESSGRVVLSPRRSPPAASQLGHARR